MQAFQKSNSFLQILFVAIACLFAKASFATSDVVFDETLTVLSFGDFEITDNVGAQFITARVDNAGCNGEDHSSGISFNGVFPSCGVYELSGFDANDTFSVIVNFQDLNKVGAPSTANEFTLDTPTTNSPLQADSSGNAVLYLGATLHTTPGNGAYPSGNYSGTMQIIINFD